ncbi:MAG TPA: Lpg1974 family pore-forming outer membrane protein [Parachlamydiaceae bacterium]|nr:Lpg1974 family pore-forming outer membrane protein [Parachlamydiaceae bacterium]
MFLRCLERSFATVLCFLTLSFAGSVSAENCFEESPCKGFKVYGQFLYWKASQDQMQYAAVLPNGVQGIMDAVQTAPPLLISGKPFIVDQKFRYKPGFRIGFDYSGLCSDWDIGLSWTRLHQKQSSCISRCDQGVIPLEMPAAIAFGFIDRDESQFGFADAAKSCWNFQYDVIDLQFARDCRFSDCLNFKPFVGVKAASIRQKQNIEYFGFTLDNAEVIVMGQKKNHFYGIGPSLGFDSCWRICQNWSLSGGVSAALLYGRFHVKTHPHVLFDVNSIQMNLKNSKKCRVRPTVDANIGLNWESCVCGKFPVTIGIAYEMQYWWNQWQPGTSAIGSLINGGSSSQGDLMLQGLTVNVGLAF